MSIALNTLKSLGSAIAIAATLAGSPVRAETKEEAKLQATSLVEKGQSTIREFTEHEDFASLKSQLAKANGVLVFPRVVNGGLVVGGTGGTGMLFRRDQSTGRWSGPAFYSMAGASIGLQAGASTAEMIIVVKSRKALESLYSKKLKIGVDASAALGTKGKGRGAALNSDFIVYSKVKGAFVGVALDGAVLDIRESLNTAYYNQAATPVDILVTRSVDAAGAAVLQGLLGNPAN
jgi:lipid-binding SYLF domain-containing protein